MFHEIRKLNYRNHADVVIIKSVYLRVIFYQNIRNLNQSNTIAFQCTYIRKLVQVKNKNAIGLLEKNIK